MKFEETPRELIRSEVSRAISMELAPYLSEQREAKVIEKEFGDKPMSIEEASEFLDLAKQTIYKGTSEGTIPFHKRGGKLWFFRGELVNYIKNGKTEE